MLAHCTSTRACLPFEEVLPPDRGWFAKQCWDVLRGRIVVVINLKAHASNKGNILHPILGMEDKVRNCLSLLVN